MESRTFYETDKDNRDAAEEMMLRNFEYTKSKVGFSHQTLFLPWCHTEKKR